LHDDQHSKEKTLMTPNQEGPVASVDKVGKIYDEGGLRVLVVLALWFFVAIALGLSGALGGEDGATRPPIGLALAMTIPLLAFVIDGRLGGPLFGPVRALPLSTLIAAQTFRIVGASFLVASWTQSALPAAFALPAGLGDVAIGLLAPFVAAAVSRRTPGHRFWATAWNVAGLVDLGSAVFLGVTHTSSLLGIFATHPTTDALARYPFNLITTFLVPIAIVLHALAFRRLLARGASQPPTPLRAWYDGWVGHSQEKEDTRGRAQEEGGQGGRALSGRAPGSW
jgi:hypothetical protein